MALIASPDVELRECGTTRGDGHDRVVREVSAAPDVDRGDLPRQNAGYKRIHHFVELSRVSGVFVPKESTIIPIAPEIDLGSIVRNDEVLLRGPDLAEAVGDHGILDRHIPRWPSKTTRILRCTGT